LEEPTALKAPILKFDQEERQKVRGNLELGALGRRGSGIHSLKFDVRKIVDLNRRLSSQHNSGVTQETAHSSSQQQHHPARSSNSSDQLFGQFIAHLKS